MNAKYSTLDWAFEAVTLFFIAGTLIYTVSEWNSIPDVIPAHYDFFGHVNAWGPKSRIIIIAASMPAVYLIITVASFFPKTWNLPVKITEQSSQRQYAIGRRLLQVIKLETMILFSYITFCAILSRDLGVFCFGIVIIVLFVTTVWFTNKLKEQE